MNSRWARCVAVAAVCAFGTADAGEIGIVGKFPLPAGFFAQAGEDSLARSLTRVSKEDQEHWLANLHPGSPPEVQPRLIQILTNDAGQSLLMRRKASVALGIVGTPTTVTLEAVRRELRREQESMVGSLLWLIAAWSSEAAGLLPEVRSFRGSASASIRFLSALAEKQLTGNLVVLPSDLSSTVRGRTFHIARSRPGDFTGKPGVWLPPTPAPGTVIYFLGDAGLFQAVADQEGNYEVKLPPGKYDVASLSHIPDIVGPSIELLVHQTTFGEFQPIEVQKGQTLELHPSATELYPD